MFQAPIVVGTTTIGEVGVNSAGLDTFEFNADATEALVNQFMRTLTYEYTGTTPPTNLDVTWVFDDGDGGEPAFGATTVVFDQLPVVDLNGAGSGIDGSLIAFTEGDPATPIAPLATIDDLGEGDIVSLSIDAIGLGASAGSEIVIGGATLTSGTPDSGIVTVGGTTFAYDYDGSNAIFLSNDSGFSAPVPVADVQLLIRSVEYRI